MNSLYTYAQASPGLVMERQRNAFLQQALLQHWAHPQVLSLLIGNEYGKMMINQKKKHENHENWGTRSHKQFSQEPSLITSRDWCQLSLEENRWRHTATQCNTLFSTAWDDLSFMASASNVHTCWSGMLGQAEPLSISSSRATKANNDDGVVGMRRKAQSSLFFVNQSFLHSRTGDPDHFRCCLEQHRPLSRDLPELESHLGNVCTRACKACIYYCKIIHPNQTGRGYSTFRYI